MADIWTTTLPTEPGDYFWRRVGSKTYGIVRLKKHDGKLWICQGGEWFPVTSLQTHGYEWCPVSPPGAVAAVEAERARLHALLRPSENEHTAGTSPRR